MKFLLVIIAVVVGLFGLSSATICGIDAAIFPPLEHVKNFDDVASMLKYNEETGSSKLE